MLNKRSYSDFEEWLKEDDNKNHIEWDKTETRLYADENNSIILKNLFQMSEQQGIVEMLEPSDMYKFRLYLNRDDSFQVLLMKNIGKEKGREDDWRVWNSSPFGENPVCESEDEIKILNCVGKIASKLGVLKVTVPLKNAYSLMEFRGEAFNE